MNAPITNINCLGNNFPIARTSVAQKNCFRIICVMISGLIVVSTPVSCRSTERHSSHTKPPFVVGSELSVPHQAKVLEFTVLSPPHQERSMDL